MKKTLYVCALILLNLFLIACDRSNKPEALFTQSNDDVCADEEVPNEFMVKWKNGTISKVSNMDQNTFINKFLAKNIETVERSEPNYKMRLKPPSIKSFNTCSSNQWHLENINVQKFCDNNHLGDEVTIAVTDSGIDLNNDLLKSAIALNPGENGLDENGVDKSENGKDDDNNGYIDDSLGIDLIDSDTTPNDTFGHGTSVSATIIYEGEDDIRSIDLKGIAPKVKIIPIKFIDRENGTTETAIQAIQYAVSRKADIINASWGGHDCSSILPDYLKTIEREETLLVAASGNEGLNIDDLVDVPPVYPASMNLKNQITVGSISAASLKRSSFSNYGISSVELFAPGDDIITLGLDEKVQCLDGTSFSAPIVSGALALIMSAFPEKNHLQIKKTLLDYTLKDDSYKNLTTGTLNLENILNDGTQP